MTVIKLEIDKRLDRIENAIGTMAQWLVQAQTGFNANDAAGIEKILRGEKVKEPENDSEQSSGDHPDPERQEEPGPEVS